MNAQVHGDQLTFVEKCDFADAESDVYIYRATIERGQIQQCTVSSRHLPVGAAAYPVLREDQQVMVDDDPPRAQPAPHRTTTDDRVGSRILAGNFFG